MHLYTEIKKLLLRIVPKALIFRYEYHLRYFYYLLFKGNKYQCNICGKKIRSFVNLQDDRLCPQCGSLQRTRRLWQLLGEFLRDNQNILDFSPSRSLYRLLKKGNYNYISSDLSGDFIADVSYNITNIAAEDNHFDLIICYHVLEHVEEDLKAMKELWRVLKKGGYCIVQTPFKTGQIYEDTMITTPEARKKHFGQADHVRIYSVKALQNRMESVGFQIEVRNYKEDYENSFGFQINETVLIGNKP